MILVTVTGVRASVVVLKKSAMRWQTSPPRTRTSRLSIRCISTRTSESPVNRILGHVKNVILIDPQEYLPFVWLMNHAWLILTDSGGIQEEAPSLGKPVLVMRDTTERPEAVTAGTVRLVGTDKQRIVEEVTRLLKDENEYQAMSRAHNPYGDGQACSRILEALKNNRISL